MKLTLFNESIAHFDKYIQEMLMSEHPHGRIQASEIIPHGNYIDLGFENYGVPEKPTKHSTQPSIAPVAKYRARTSEFVVVLATYISSNQATAPKQLRYPRTGDKRCT